MRKSLWVLFLLIIFYTQALAVETGYMGKITYTKGDTLKFHLSSALANNTITIYRYGNIPTLIQTINNVPGGDRTLPDSSYYYGCNWPVSYQMKIPDNWLPGAYYATYTISTGRPRLWFFVKEPNPGSYSNTLVILATNTWNAYNPYGGKSIYDYNSPGGRSYKVSFQRPDENWFSGPFEFRKNELHLMLWLSRNNINVEYASNYDVYSNPNLLQNYKLVIIAGHNEYWSYPERIQCENFVRNGGNMMILSGNTCWWQIRYENDGNTLVCYKELFRDPYRGVIDSLVTINYYDTPINNSENSFIGVSFRSGGFVNNNGTYTKAQGYGGFSIYNSHHWIYEGTNYKDGDLLGYNESIVGNEVDGALFTYVNGIPKFTGADRSPQDFMVLGGTPALNNTIPAYTTNHHGFMGMFHYPGGGTIFNSSSINWNLGLSFINVGNNNSAYYGSDTNLIVQNITKNLITRLSTNNIPPDIVSWSPFTLESKTIMNEALQLNRRNITLTSAQSVNFNISAVDPFSGALSYKWEVNNVDQNINSASFAKDFTSSDPANSIVKVTVTNSKGSTSLSWNVSSNITPTVQLDFTSTPKTTVEANTNYTDTLTVFNYWNDPLVFTIEGAPWLSINSQGIVTGTAPAQQGTFNVTARVSNQHNQTDSLSWTINVTVVPPAKPLAFTSTPKTTVIANTTYTDTLTVFNFWNDSLVFSVTGATWLSVNSQGILTGTAPAQQGTFNVTARVTDQHNDADSLSWTINVAVVPPAKPLAFTSTPKTSVNANTSYLDTLKVFNFWNDSLVFSVTGAAWLSVNSQGILTGTAPANGTFNVTARVTDQHNDADSLLWTINVIPVVTGNTEISSFTGVSTTTYVDLFWTTSKEVNNQGFDIEKLTGKTWKRLGFVQGVGNSNTNNNYTFKDNTIKKGDKSASYRLKQINTNGTFQYTNPIVITIKAAAFALGQNYPNPFNPSTLINYALVDESNVKMIIYNSIGEVVFRYEPGIVQAGYHDITFNASELASGIYFYTIEIVPSSGAEVFKETRKMLLVK